MLSVLPVRRPATITVVLAPISCVNLCGLLKYTFFCAIVSGVLGVREKRVKFQIHFLELDILNVDASGTVTMLTLPLTDDVEARLFPIEPTDDEARAADELWDEIDNALQCADAFADYPILDEQDYSDRCWDAWEAAMSDELESLGFNPESDDAVQIATYVSEHYQGYAEDGWVDIEWIREAAAEFGIAIPED